MLTISILKVENPSCLWGRVLKGPGSDAENAKHYRSLMAEMNLFYHGVTQDLCKMKPESLEEGQVCVVYWAGMKSWCRAVLEAVLVDSFSVQARCHLVDHGERIVVPSNQIRVTMPKFFELPFWVRKFQLAGIKPTTLQVSVHEQKAELIPSSQWDSSATLYLHNLLRASTRTEAVLLETEDASSSIQLYLTVNGIKVCVNDDLVAKKFAYYRGTFSDDGGLDAGDRLPIMLSPNILTQTLPNKLTSQHQQPCEFSSPTVTTESSDSEAGDCPMTQPLQQRHLNVASGGDERSEVTEDQVSRNQQSENNSVAAAVAERFLKFLNLGDGCQKAVPNLGQNDDLSDYGSKDRISMLASCTEPEQETTITSSNTNSNKSDSGAAEMGKAWQEGKDCVCSRLLEWLNPEPFNPDPDKSNDVVLPSDPAMNGILVHSALQVEPCSNMDDAPITDSVRWVLQRKQNYTLSAADCYSWPAVARGCNTLIVSHIADQPLSYLAPLLTHILLNSIFSSLSSSSGPVAVVLCPGWERVQAVYDILEESRVSKILHPVIVILGIGKDEAKDVKIPKNCLLLVTTPFSLVQLLSCQCFLFLRLYHLVLDEADQLFTVAPDKMATIVEHFQKVTSNEEKVPKQLVAVAKRWTSHMEDLITNHMPSPCIVITVPEEAALYGNVHQATLMTLESNKISALLGVLDFSPDVGQKTLIVANSVQEVEDVFKAVKNKSAFCLRTHEGLTHQFDFVIQQWRKDIGPGSHVILVTTNECLPSLHIRDATCVIHYGFPTSPKLFGSRLFCMAEHFRNLSERDQTKYSSHVTRSVLLISERNARHVFGVLRYLGRTDAALPPGLLSFAEGVHVAREQQKSDRPLCKYLKSFGFCRDSSVCPDRHKFNSQLDQSVLPASGVIEVVPVYIKTASVFYGRIARKEDKGFDELTSEMASYYADKRPGARELLVGRLYAVQEDKLTHRVKVLSLPDSVGSLFFSVLVRFIDVGKEEEVKSHQILQLPEPFQSLPAQAVEVIVCRVKPVHAETDWHPKVIRAISLKIRGLQHRAKAVFSLGNTVFVDPMVRVTQIQGMKTVINEYDVRSEILNTGMGVSNPEHLDLLRELCQEDLANSSKYVDSEFRVDGLPPLEVGTKAEEEVLAEVSRVDEVRKAAALDPLQFKPGDPFTRILSTTESSVQRVSGCDRPSLMESPADGGELCNGSIRTACRVILENGVPKGQELSLSFHPHIRWYQTCDSVIVKVKLLNPESQNFEFYPDRVIYRSASSRTPNKYSEPSFIAGSSLFPVPSGRVNARSYRADLQLLQTISADISRWEMISNEPVLKLVKQQPGYWDRLVRTKNIFVSYDMEHIDEKVENASNGVCFVENTGEENWYVNSESGSESD
ncbi:putative ATP-dependent RNA helicase TDRD12 [Menidia menidia]